MDTIFAQASAQGKSGVAIIRLSGPFAHDAVRQLAGDVPEARRASLRTLRWHGDLIDEALVLIFAEGASFTGEASAELQLHGSIAVTRAVLGALASIPGLRPADPGEFTRRALENGRLDLAQVEGLADLIDSETEVQRKQAQRVLSGSIGARTEVWRARLIRAAALLEATIDFADEDVPFDVAPEVLGLIDQLLEEFRNEAEGARVAERIRDGFEVAIVGRPNSGKSTLINALAGRDAALTSDVPGTTRDVIEVRMDLGGLPVTILDTAGLRETDDKVESLGIARALMRARDCDLRVFLLDGSGIPDGIVPQKDDILIHGKADLGTSSTLPAVSGLTGAGITDLMDVIAAELAKRMARAGTITRDRHRLALVRAIDALVAARSEVNNGPDRSELAAEHLRSAIRAVDLLVGRIGVELLLGEIFSSFCIGK